jgi:hypothetical protein
MNRAPFIVAAWLLAIAQSPASASAATTSLALIAEDRELPWNDVVMVVILVLAFSGGTAAIINSARRR